VLYATAGVGLALSGPGRYSLDALLGIRSPWTTTAIWGALVVGAVGGFVNLALRRAPPAAPAS